MNEGSMNESIPVLMYHSVSENPTAATRRLSVDPGALDRQVAFLAQNGYTGMTFSHLADALAVGKPLPEKPVVLTFDDGYADFAQVAWPILRSHDFPATVFVTSGWIDDAGTNAAGHPLGPMLNWAQVRELAAAGVEIGAHSHSHAQLDQCADAALCDELRLGRILLEDCVGTPVRSLAYPFGYSTPRVRVAARAAGYRCAASVRNIRATASGDPFMIPRLTIRRSTDDNDFASIMSGDKQFYLRDRVLTAGYATVRGARRAGRRVVRHG